MEKISINSIFGNYCNCDKQENLSINNMFNKIDESDILNKLEAKKRRKEKELQNMYNEKYKECLIKINSSIMGNEEQIFYVIPFEKEKIYCDYSSIKCLEYISKNLTERGFFTQIITNTKIYISWKYINK